MPVDKISDAPANIRELNDVKLTLAQINWILNVYDGLQDNPDVDSPMAVAISQFKESWEVKDGKWVKKASQSEASLDDIPHWVRTAFYQQFDPPSTVMGETWVVEIFEDYLIVESGTAMYKVGYTRDDDNIVFAPRDEWQEVEQTYAPLVAFKRGLGSLLQKALDLFPAAGGARKPAVARLSSVSAGRIFTLTGDGERELLTDDDGLVWKDLLVDGRWFTLDGDDVIVTRSEIDHVYDAFVNGNLYPVPIPFTHVEHMGGDDPANNNGFVRAMRIGGESPDDPPNGEYVLWVGMDVTEPDTLEKLERGSIDNVSAWLEPDVHDNKDEGVVWPLVLWHVALTDKPQLDLKPFAVYAVKRRSIGMSEPSVNTTQPPADQVEPDDELEALKARLAEAEKELSESKGQVTTLQQQVESMAGQLTLSEEEAHERDVDAIVGALQGQGRHKLVDLKGQMVPPAVLSAIRPVLVADAPKQGKRMTLSVSRKNGEDGDEALDLSPTQIVLDVVQGFADAGLLLDTVRRGSVDHSDPTSRSPEDEKAAKDEEVEAFAKRHPEIKRM